MLKDKYSYYLANEPAGDNFDLEVTDKYSGEVAARVAMADAKVIEEAIAHSVEAAAPMAQMAPFERQDILNITAASKKTCRLPRRIGTPP